MWGIWWSSRILLLCFCHTCTEPLHSFLPQSIYTGQCCSSCALLQADLHLCTPVISSVVFSLQLLCHVISCMLTNILTEDSSMGLLKRGRGGGEGIDYNWWVVWKGLCCIVDIQAWQESMCRLRKREQLEERWVETGASPAQGAPVLWKVLF